MATAAALGLALAACGDAAPARRVLVYSAHGRDLLEDVERSFEAAHPEVDVVWQDMGADQAYDRIRGERADPQADVWWGGPAFRFAQAAEQGLLAPHRPTWADAAPADMRDAQWRWAGHFAMPQVIAFQAGRVTDPPRDWPDLASARWRDRIVLRNPSASGGMKGAFGAVFAHLATTTGSDDAAHAWFVGVAANVRQVTQGPVDLFTAIRRDTVGIVTIWNLTDVLYQSEVAEPRVPFAWVCPASGAPTFPDCIALVAHGGRAPGEDAAAFYEHVTSADVSLALAEKHRRFLVRTDLARPSWAARIDCRPMPVDWSLVGRRIDEWERSWEDALAARPR